MHLQSPGEAIPTHTLPSALVAGSAGPTLALLQAALPEGPGGTRVLAVASYEAGGTLAPSSDGIAHGSVLTPAALAAARAPVSVVTG